MDVKVRQVDGFLEKIGVAGKFGKKFLGEHGYLFLNISRAVVNCGIDGQVDPAIAYMVPSPRRPRKSDHLAQPVVRFRPRVIHRGEIALGPGKAELLAAIRAQGSIARGAASLDMSYMRAWTLVKIMNQAFREPLVEVDRGGPRGGAAHLTTLGSEVLELYLTLVKQCDRSTRATWKQLRQKLK